MRRWSAAAFFVGLALLCGALLEFHRWPTLQVTTHPGDFDELAGYEFLWFPDLHGRWEHVASAWREPFGQGLWFTQFVDRGLIALLTVGGFGLLLLLVLRGRRTLGGSIVALSSFAGVAFLALTALDVRASDRIAGCSPAPNPLQSPELLESASWYALAAALIAAVAWLWSHRGSGVRLLSAAIAAGISLAMVVVVFVADRFAFTGAPPELDTAMPPLWPISIIAMLAAIGVVFAIRTPLLVSHGVSAFVFAAGVIALAPVISLEHDLLVEVHPSWSSVPRDWVTVPITHCETPALSPNLLVSRDEVSMSGTDLWRRNPDTLSLAVAAQVREMEAQYVELHRQADPNRAAPPWLDRRFTLVVDAATPIDTLIAPLRGLQTSGVHRMQLISMSERPERLWTKAAPHRHQCAVYFELSSDGLPMSGFATWSELVKAIDSAPGELRLSPR